MQDKLIDYLEGTLSAAEVKKMDAVLESDEDLRQEMEALRATFQAMDEVEMVDPPASLKTSFHSFLEEEQARQLRQKDTPVRRLWRPMELGIAAAIALLILGTGMGILWQNNQKQQAQLSVLQEEVANTRKLLILSMLEQKSASDRIKAMNTVAPKEADPQIVQALIQRLEIDENVNVRIKAAEALANFPNQPKVVDVLVDALSEESVEVQIVLIDILVGIGAKQAVPAFEELMKKDGIMTIVKEKAADGVGKLI